MMRRPVTSIIEKIGRHFYQAKLVKLSGEIIDLSALGFEVVSINDPSPDESLLSEELEEQDGYIDLGTKLESRSPTLTIYFLAHTYQDAALRRRELYALFSSRERFYLRTNAEPGKQLLLRRVGGIAPKDAGAYTFSVEISLSASSPYWESIDDAFAAPSIEGHFAAGLGFDLDEISDSKTTGSRAILYNKGTAVIDARNVQTKLKITVRGVTTNLRLLNLANGSSVKVTTTTTASDTLVFDGVRILKNGLSIFGLSDHGALVLEIGRNEIDIQGSNGAEVTFNAKNYYI